MLSNFPYSGAVPLIETERLRLRGHRIEDFQKSAAMWADPKVVRHIGGQSSSIQQSWARMLNYTGHWTMMGFGYWLIEEKLTGQFVGEIGFADFKRELDPPIVNVPEAGWVLSPSCHGKGYATEALGAAVFWGDDYLVGKRTVCIINPENAQSINVAKKCGYRQLQNVSYKGELVILFERVCLSRSPRYR